MIKYILLSSLLSTGLHLFKNNAADNSIRRSGLIITSDKRSLSEKVMTFLREYAYIIIPGYNLYKSFKKLIQKDSEYKAERLLKLRESERIQDKPVLSDDKNFKKEESSLKDKVVEKSKSVVKKITDSFEKNDNNDSKNIFDTSIDSIEHVISSIAPYAKRRIILKRKDNLSKSEKVELSYSEEAIRALNTSLSGLTNSLSYYINSCNDVDTLSLNYDKFNSMNKVLSEKHAKIKEKDSMDPELNIIVRKYKIYSSIINALKNRINTLNNENAKLMK